MSENRENIFGKVPRSNKISQEVKKPVETTWQNLQNREKYNLWANRIILQDQSCRGKNTEKVRDEIIKVANELKVGLDSKCVNDFLQSLQVGQRLELQIKMQNYLQNERNNDQNLQQEVLIFLEENRFPNIQKLETKILMAIFLVLQHTVDSKFQNYGLKMMSESRQNNQKSISLTYFYFLIDRIVMTKFGYQFFGTQNPNGNKSFNTVRIDFDLIEFNKNPYLFCQNLFENKVQNPNLATMATTKEEMLELWKLAQKDRITSQYQDAMVEDFLVEFGE